MDLATPGTRFLSHYPPNSQSCPRTYRSRSSVQSLWEGLCERERSRLCPPMATHWLESLSPRPSPSRVGSRIIRGWRLNLNSGSSSLYTKTTRRHCLENPVYFGDGTTSPTTAACHTQSLQAAAQHQPSPEMCSATACQLLCFTHKRSLQ